jgi:predicted RND superfamily exporter protein
VRLIIILYVVYKVKACKKVHGEGVFVEKLFKYPWLVVSGVLLITVFFAIQLPKAQMNNNMTSFLPADNPARLIGKHLEEEYGDATVVMVGLERPYGTVFESAFLSRVREFQEKVEAMALVKDVSSILSTQYITSDSESIVVTDLVDEDFSGTSEEIAELKRRIGSWDMYQGSIVSDDLSSTQVVVRLTVSSEHSVDNDAVAALVQIQELAKEMFAGSDAGSAAATVYTAGEAVVSATLTSSALSDVTILIPLVVVVLLVVLVLSFRRFSYVTLPLLTVLVATIWGVGAMPLFGVKLTLLSVMLPILLIAVGSAYGIHIISHYKDEMTDGNRTIEEHRALVIALVRKLVKPVFLAALTTFAGFMSFCFASLASMREFGIFASFGVLSALAVALTLIPAILLIRGQRAIKLSSRKKTKAKTVRFDFANELADTMTTIAGKKALVLILTALVLVVTAIGSSKVIVDSSMVEFFSATSEVARSDRFIREHFGGSNQLIVSVEADDTETLLSPEVLGALDGLTTYLTTRVPYVGKVTGFTDMVKRMNQMFNVDESPDGLAAVNTGYNDDEFGFGDFGGFGDFEDNAGEVSPSLPPAARSTATPSGGAPPPQRPRPYRQALSQTETMAETARGGPPHASAETAVSFAMINSAIGKKANMSANELARELQRMTNYEGYSYYEIPAEPERYGKQTSGELAQLVSNYLVLLAGDADDSMSNDPLEPTAIETIILVNSQWQKDARNVMNAINSYVAANFPKNVKVFVGGGATQTVAITDLVTSSQIISLVLAVVAVLIIVALSNKSLAAGLIATMPLLIAILSNFAVMGFFGIPLNLSTAMIASLSVGIGIDYTIHCMETFKREFKDGGDFLRRTFATSGKAILINAVSVGGSFAVLLFSNFRVVAQFGGLVALSMVVSAIVSLTVVPVLLTTVKPGFIYGR